MKKSGSIPHLLHHKFFFLSVIVINLVRRYLVSLHLRLIYFSDHPCQFNPGILPLIRDQNTFVNTAWQHIEIFSEDLRNVAEKMGIKQSRCSKTFFLIAENVHDLLACIQLLFLITGQFTDQRVHSLKTVRKFSAGIHYRIL